MEGLKHFYRGIICTGDFIKHFLLFAFRYVWGLSFLIAGWGKLNNIDNVIDFFGSLNMPLPAFSAYLVGGVEFTGGLMLLVGFGARLAAIPLAIAMIVALLTAHNAATIEMVSKISEEYNLTKRFMNQLPFNYLLACLTILSFGPGAISLDALIKRFIIKKD